MQQGPAHVDHEFDELAQSWWYTKACSHQLAPQRTTSTLGTSCENAMLAQLLRMKSMQCNSPVGYLSLHVMKDVVGGAHLQDLSQH